MGELSLIEKFRAGAPTHPAITVGPGSDCAVLNWPSPSDLLFKIDQVVEGTHFLLNGPEAATPKQIGWKAMAKTCSDIAAAGGWPVAAMVAMNARKGSDESFVMGVYGGMIECCKRYNYGLAGGDFSSSENALSISVSLLGECAKGRAWTRSGARVGDVLLVTGALGGSYGSGKHLDFSPRLEEARHIRELSPDAVHACIDITDGLSRDLRHICRESGCGARLKENCIPLSGESIQNALADGEDFELLLAVDPKLAEELLNEWELKTPLTLIGEIVEKKLGLVRVSENGTERPLHDVGYEHHV